jgi:DNA-directed RNA polymerase subunit RPC12/RpoP
MDAKTYTCAACGQTFNNGWTDADAEREAKQVFGVSGARHRSDMAVVCDDCYKAMIAAYPPGE